MICICVLLKWNIRTKCPIYLLYYTGQVVGMLCDEHYWCLLATSQILIRTSTIYQCDHGHIELLNSFNFFFFLNNTFSLGLSIIWSLRETLRFTWIKQLQIQFNTAQRTSYNVNLFLEIPTHLFHQQQQHVPCTMPWPWCIRIARDTVLVLESKKYDTKSK